MKRILFLILVVGGTFGEGSHATPQDNMEIQLKQLDDAFEGHIGLALEDLHEDRKFHYDGERFWYLSSTIKVPVAIVLLKEVEKGSLGLEQKVTLKETDVVDGAGDLQFQQPGKTFSASDLLKRMIVDSDSTATDMLIRLVGEEKLNKSVQELTPGFGKITTILQVRYDAYAELHPHAQHLQNMDFIEIKKKKPEHRTQFFAKKVNVPLTDLKYPDLEQAFEAYYKKNFNSGSLTDFSHLLKRLGNNELLNKKHTDLLLKYMSNITTGNRRIKTGLGDNYELAQKTGTQIRRMCNMGIIRNKENKKEIAISICVEKFQDPVAAERLFKSVAEILRTHLWF
ncbi:MAG: serine hydrolase [Bdellovibrio sp.]